MDAWFAAALLLLQAPDDATAAADHAAIQVELAGLDEAWRAGALGDAHEHARNAVRLIEASDCPWRSDTAIAAALGGLSEVASGSGSGGLFFWVADQVDQRFSALPEPIASIAGNRRAEPGGSLNSDGFFLRSPYFEPETIEVGCAEPQLDPDLFSAEPAGAEAVLIAVRWPRDYSKPLWRRADLLFAYPEGEGRALFEQLRERRSTFSVNQGADIRIFDPCLTLPGPDYEYFEICRDGAAP